MNPLACNQLCLIVSRYGRGVCDDPRKVQALLADLCPDLKRERSALVAALERGAAADLTHPSAGVPWPTILGRLVRRLVDETAMAQEAAQWAVQSWAVALGTARRPRYHGKYRPLEPAAGRIGPADRPVPDASGAAPRRRGPSARREAVRAPLARRGGGGRGRAPRRGGDGGGRVGLPGNARRESVAAPCRAWEHASRRRARGGGRAGLRGGRRREQLPGQAAPPARPRRGRRPGALRPLHQQ